MAEARPGCAKLGAMVLVGIIAVAGLALIVIAALRNRNQRDQDF